MSTVIVDCPDCARTVRLAPNECRLNQIADSTLLSFICTFCDETQTKPVDLFQSCRMVYAGVERVLLDDPVPP